MKRKGYLNIVSLLISLVFAFGLASVASAAVKVRVQPSGPDIPSAYAIPGEERTYFGNVEGGASGNYQYMWEFSNGGGTAWAGVTNTRYISINHIFGSAGLNWARLTVHDTDNQADEDSAIIEVYTLAVDTTNRQKNSAVDRGLRRLYLQEIIDAAGSHWQGGGYPVALTSMALIAFENHRHNIEASDDDIYKKSVEGGLQWLFNHAYEVDLSVQACIGDPEGIPGNPDYDDGDSDNDDTGITFNNCGSSGDCGDEGYEMPLAMLAIVNSCEKATAQSLTASSTSSSFVDGMTYWDIAVDAKDFLAYAQTDRAGGGGFEDWCNNWWDGLSGEYYVDQMSGPEFNFEVDLWSDDEGGYQYCESDNGYFEVYPGEGSGFEFWAEYWGPDLDCDTALFKVEYGDGMEETFPPGWCDEGYAEVYFSHEYPPDGGPYLAMAYFSPDNGVTWNEICGLEVEVAQPSEIVCEDLLFKVIYGDGMEDTFPPDWCDQGDAYGGINHTYVGTGTYPSSGWYSMDGGLTWTEVCDIDVVYSGGDTVCHPNGEGWRYTRNYNSVDNSVSQWPTLALDEAREKWDININPKAIDTFKDWLAYSQGSTSGGFCYDSPGSWENFAKTGAGLAMLKWTGYSSADTNVQNALSFLDAHWNDTGQGGNLGTDYYGMYAFYKGMKYLGIGTLGTRDWEDLYTQFLVGAQQANGSWTNSGWLCLPTPDMSTGAALAMLAPAVGGLPPVADADGPYGPVNPGQDVLLDGSGSFHQDPTKNLVLYEWDFDDGDGLWWDSGLTPDSGEGDVGISVLVSYPDTGAGEVYTLTLRVTDDSVPAQTDMDTSTVTVTTGNVPPVAQTNGPWAGLPGDTIIFDGTSSYDPNECTVPGDPSCLGDSIVSYEWDLDGDGLWNEANGDDGVPVVAGDYSIVQKAYPTPISQAVTLKVTDSYGLFDMTSPQLNIVSIALVYGTDYNYCFRDRISRFEERLGVAVLFENVGDGTAENVVVTLTQTPTNLIILKGTAALGDMAPGHEVLTDCDPAAMTADIELLFNRRTRPTGEWRWKAEFDFNGNHYIIDNLPPLAP